MHIHIPYNKYFTRTITYFKTHRSAKYIPTKVEEQSVNRWKYFTSKHLYEMINQDPRIGLNGMWRQEVETVNKYGLQGLMDLILKYFEFKNLMKDNIVEKN